MEKPLFPLWRFVYPDRYFERSGVIELNTLDGTLEINKMFAIYILDVDIYNHKDDLLFAPCDSPREEFINVDIRAGGRTTSFDDYSPDADGIPFSPEDHTMIITWQSNTRKTLYWRAGGFR